MKEYLAKHSAVLGIVAAYFGGVAVTVVLGLVLLGGLRPEPMFSDAAGNPRYIGPAECDPNNQTKQCLARQLVFTSPDVLPVGAQGQPYAYQLAVSGGTAPYYFESIGDGVTDPYPCCLLGISREGQVFSVPGVVTLPYAGTFQVGVRVVDASGVKVATKIFTLHIDPENAGGPLEITGSNTLPSGRVGEPYYHQFQFDGGMRPYAWSISPRTSLNEAYPAGHLALSRSGVLYSLGSGPTLMPYSGTYQIRVGLTDGQQTVERTFSFTINPQQGTSGTKGSAGRVPVAK